MAGVFTNTGYLTILGGPSKKSIVDFVERVTYEGGPDYVKPEERIATFDHDGTLWAEQPMYFQIVCDGSGQGARTLKFVT
jgi:hypothetical protein